MNDPSSLVSHGQTYSARHHSPAHSSLASSEHCPNPFKIRVARLEDLPSLAVLIIESFYPPESWINWLSPLLRMGIHQELGGRLRFTSSDYACLVATRDVLDSSTDVNLVGTVEVALRRLSPWQFSASKHPYISNLAVKLDYRRQKVAQQLLFACEQTVLGWGLQDLYLHVLENNQPARQLYAKLGYQVKCIDGTWPQLLFGQPRRLLLHKHLTQAF